jgi:AAA domain
LPTEHYVPGLWPKHRFNLVSGASGAGKSRWIIPQLFALREGKPIMGEQTKPIKIAYVCCDRTSEDAKDTMSDLGHDASLIPVFSFMDNDLDWSFSNVVNFVPAGTNLVFIEAVGALVPGGNMIDYHSVLRLGRLVNKTRRSTGFDFWGSTHTPKLKKGEDFKHTRDNVIGSSAWPGIAGTIVHIHENDQGQREIHILTRDDAARTLYYEFDLTGHLVECHLIIGTVILDSWLKQFTAGTILTVDQIMEQAAKAKVSRRTVFRWIDDKVNEGLLLRLGKGMYEVRNKM